MFSALLGLVAAVLVLVGRLARLRLLGMLAGALTTLALTAWVHCGVSYFDELAPWHGWATVALLLAIGYLIARTCLLVVFEWLLKQRVGFEAPRLVRDVVALLVYLLTAATVLRAGLGIEVGALLATSAVLTVVIGLALQETLGTLLAGLTLAWEQRLKEGEWIEIEGIIGQVEELGWRSLVIRTLLDELILLPNLNVVRARLRLLGSGKSPIAVPVRLGVAYGCPPDQVKEVLQRVAGDLPGVLAEPGPQILVTEFADSAVIFECRLWTHKPWAVPAITDALLTNAHAALARAGMEIPFPQRSVHMVAPPPEADGAAEIAAALARCSLFSGLPEGPMEAVAVHSRRLRWAPGERVISEGEESRALYLVVSGSAVVERSGQVLSRLESGEVFGEMAFLSGEPRAATVRAVGPLVVVEVDALALAALLGDHRDLADELASRVAERQQQIDEAGTRTDKTQSRRGLVAHLRVGLLRLVGAVRGQ